MDKEIKWGAEIPVTIVDGKKPEFLRDDQICAVWRPLTGWLALSSGNWPACDWGWTTSVTKIKLLADDPYYQQEDRTPAPEVVDIELRKWVMEQAVAVGPHLNGKVTLRDLADDILAWVTEKP